MYFYHNGHIISSIAAVVKQNIEIPPDKRTFSVFFNHHEHSNGVFSTVEQGFLSGFRYGNLVFSRFYLVVFQLVHES